MIRTWMREALVVAAVLTLVAFARHRAVEFVGAAAVLVAFMHAQVATRMAEREALRARPDVHCWPWLGRYYVAKEILWSGYFVWIGAWSALVGVAVFLLYPMWRRWHRRRVIPSTDAA